MHSCKCWLLNISGWHRRINGKAAKAGMGFYVLVPLLRKEAEGVTLQMQLVSENLLNKIHRKQYRQIHGRLFDVCYKYDDGDITTLQLLRRAVISQHYALQPRQSKIMSRQKSRQSLFKALSGHVRQRSLWDSCLILSVFFFFSFFFFLQNNFLLLINIYTSPLF